MEDISHLLRKGIAELGLRSFVMSVDEAKKRYGLEEVIKLSGNTNPLGPSPKAVEEVKMVAERMNLYPDPQALQLRSVIARLRNVEADQILQGNGTSELIHCVGVLFINEGDECIVPEGTFKPYRDICHVMGGKINVSPLKEYRIDLKDMADRVTSRTKLVIMVNPNNPTGDILRHGEVEAFLREVGKDVIVVFDEAYGEFVEDEAYANTLEFIRGGYRVIALRSLSKAYGLAGSRIGYAVSSPDIVECLNAVRLRFNVNMFAQTAAIAALKDRDHLDKSLQLVWNEKRFYYKDLNALGLFYVPTSANFLFVEVGVDDLKLRDHMLRKGVMITPLTPWGFKGFVRVSIGTHYENTRMMDCLKESLEEWG